MSHTERAREMLDDLRIPEMGVDQTFDRVSAKVAALLAREAAMEFALLKAEIGMRSAARLLHETHTPCLELAHGLAAVTPLLVAPAPSQPRAEAPAPAEAPAVPSRVLARIHEQALALAVFVADMRLDAIIRLARSGGPLYDAAALASARESGRREGIEQAATLAEDYGTAGRFYAQAIRALP